MHALVTCKAKLDRINSNREKLETLILILRRTSAANSVVSLLILTKFELFQALMYVLITCKFDEDPIINSQEKVETCFSHYKPMRIFQVLKGS